MSDAPRLILASLSPRRLELLSQIAIAPAEIVPTDIDETPRRRELPADLARRLALEKAIAAADRYARDFVLAADTVVGLGRRILPKPCDEAEARVFLELLSGRRHVVHGGICVIAPGRRSLRVVKTGVHFKRLAPGEIDSYIAGGEWRDKAGGYAIQGAAAAFIPAINGSYSNVVGLSLADVTAMLVGLGYPC